MEYVKQMLARTSGRALLLFPSKEELDRFKREVKDDLELLEMLFLFEGDQEISHLISAFQKEETSNL